MEIPFSRDFHLLRALHSSQRALPRGIEFYEPILRRAHRTSQLAKVQSLNFARRVVAAELATPNAA